MQSVSRMRTKFAAVFGCALFMAGCASPPSSPPPEPVALEPPPTTEPLEPRQIVEPKIPRPPEVVAASPEPGTVATPKPEPARFQALRPGDSFHDITWDKQARRFVLHVPPGYTGVQALPVVVVLHGRGSSAQAARLLGFSQKADREKFLVVYPESLGNPRIWNSRLEPNTQTADDLGYLQAVLDRVAQSVNIDSRRLYFVGHSSGGMMAYRAAVEFSPRIAAVSVVGASVGAGQAGEFTRLPASGRPVSVLHIHGRNDRTVPFAGGKSATLSGANYLSARESVDFWVKSNRCQPAARSSTVASLSREIYATCDGGTSVEFLTLLAGGHEWPRAVRTDAGSAPSAVDLMWTFFAAHVKP